MHKFLIDECLSPKLAGLAHEHGFDASHVNWIRLDRTPDRVIARHAVATDHVVVTANGVDFRPIYRALDLHPGLIVVLPSMRRVNHAPLFIAVLVALAEVPDLINTMIEVSPDGTLAFTEWSATS